MPDTYIIIRRISNKNSMKKHFLLLILSLLFLPIAQGKVKLPAMMGDHMVLQQNSSVKLWGWADGKKVTVYDEVEKTIKKDMPSRLRARREMLKVLYTVTEVPTAAAGKKKNTKEVDLTAKLFDEIAPKYADRNGGYTRIVKIGQRKGDGALEVLLELV